MSTVSGRRARSTATRGGLPTVLVVGGCLVSGLIVAGCSASGTPHSSAATTSSATAAVSSGPAVLSASLPRTADTLSTAMRHGLAVATSAHVSVRLPGHTPTSGSMTLAGGTPTSLSLAGGSGSAALRLVVVNSVAYARTGTRASWSPVPETGRLRPALRRARTVLTLVRAAVSPAALLTSLRGARLQVLGRGAVGSLPAAHYRLRLAAPAGRQLDLWVDGGSRPLVVGGHGHGTVRFSAYGAAVHITAPAPSDISR